MKKYEKRVRESGNACWQITLWLSAGAARDAILSRFVLLVLASLLVLGCSKSSSPNDNQGTRRENGAGNPRGSNEAGPQTNDFGALSKAPGGDSASMNSRPKPTPVEPHPRTDEFSEADLKRDNVIFLLAFDSLPRQTFFCMTYQATLRPEQIDRARDIVATFDEGFAKLRDQRAEILERASDQLDVAGMLKNNAVETAILARQVRRTIFREVLSPEQKKNHLAYFAELMEQKKRKQEEAKQRQAEQQTTPASAKSSEPAQQNKQQQNKQQQKNSPLANQN